MAENGSASAIVLRHGTVLTMDADHRVLTDADVLVVDGLIAAVGEGVEAPPGAREIDASGGIVMPGMIDTHRHLWQTAMRGYGADWTLTQYFVWYYLEHGRKFRPEDIYAGNLLGAIEAIDAGVTTTVDWSHGLQTVEHAAAAVEALQEVPARFVLAYGNIQAAPWEWTAQPEVRRFLEERKRAADDRLRVQLAFDVTGDPSFPERAAFEVARELELPVTTHAGVWGATNDDGIRLMHENGFATPETVYVHAATLERGLLPADRGQRWIDLGVDGVGAERRPGLPAYLAGASLRHPGVAVDGHQRLVERRPLLGDADHARRGPGARAPGGARGRRHGDLGAPAGRARRRLGHSGRRRGAQAGRPGQPGAGQEGRRGADQERRLAGVLPAAEPVRARGVSGPAGRRAHGDHRRPGGQGRAPAGRGGSGEGPHCRRRHRGLPAVGDGRGRVAGRDAPGPAGDDKVLDNPYTYTDYRTAATREARESIFGEAASS